MTFFSLDLSPFFPWLCLRNTSFRSLFLSLLVFLASSRAIAKSHNKHPWLLQHLVYSVLLILFSLLSFYFLLSSFCVSLCVRAWSISRAATSFLYISSYYASIIFLILPVIILMVRKLKWRSFCIFRFLPRGNNRKMLKSFFLNLKFKKILALVS